jgi:hypothetical protein
MPLELSIEVSGTTEDARIFVESLASSPIADEDRGVTITWSPPSAVPGMTETTFELLGAIGLLSLPVSVAASIAANLITARLGNLRKNALKDAQVQARRAPELRITITIVNLERAKITKLELSNFDEPETRAICEALADMIDAD